MKILEHYARLKPRRDLRRAVARALQQVPQGYLVGIDTVLLRDTESLGRREMASRVSHRGKKVPRSLARGVYRAKTRRHAASIELFVDNIFLGWPVLTTRLAIVRDVLIVRTLYHEVGHHYHVAIHPTKGEQDDLADQTSRQLSRAFFRKHYRYYRPLLMVLRAVLLPLRFVIRRARQMAGRD